MDVSDTGEDKSMKQNEALSSSSQSVGPPSSKLSHSEPPLSHTPKKNLRRNIKLEFQARINYKN
jgi:hypothetical protein